MRQLITNPFSVSVGTVQEVGVYFSALCVECAVAIEEPRGHRLVSKFLKYPVTAFSSTLRVTYSTRSFACSLFSSISGTTAATMENVAIFDSPGKGRGLKATKEFWAGDVIFSEPSLAAVVFDRYSNSANCQCECSVLGSNTVVLGI